MGEADSLGGETVPLDGAENIISLDEIPEVIELVPLPTAPNFGPARFGKERPSVASRKLVAKKVIDYARSPSNDQVLQ